MARGNAERMWTFDEYVKEYEQVRAEVEKLKQDLASIVNGCEALSNWANGDHLKDLAAIKEIAERALRVEPCEWKWNKKDKYWDTACGCAHVWQEKHLDTRFRSCPFCARPIKENKE